MKFSATAEQVKAMAANAVNASSPVGLGILHFKAGADAKPDDFEIRSGALHLDYVDGRMVKLHIVSEGEPDTWEVYSEPRPDYQSWAAIYPSNADLVASVGAQVLEP